MLKDQEGFRLRQGFQAICWLINRFCHDRFCGSKVIQVNQYVLTLNALCKSILDMCQQ